MAWDKAHIDTELDREVRELLSAADGNGTLYRTDGEVGAAAEDCAVYRTAAAEHT